MKNRLLLERAVAVKLPFIYCCPYTGHSVQGFSAERASDLKANDYLTVLCTRCQQIHLIDPRTAKVIEEKDE
jgi:hypothetical protein